MNERSVIKEGSADVVNRCKSPVITFLQHQRATINDTCADVSGGSSKHYPTNDPAIANDAVECFVIYECEAASSQPEQLLQDTNKSATAKHNILNGKLRKRSHLVHQRTKATIGQRSDSIGLKVKCLCRLGNAARANPMNNQEYSELTAFMTSAFVDTCALTWIQQRNVQRALLEAICLSEEEMAKGKSCERCCPVTEAQNA